MLGRYPVMPWDLVKIVLSKFINIETTWSSSVEAVVNLRIVRAAAAVFIGAALGAAGTAYQGMFRNPMVSPDVLGASNGAAFGAALAIFCSFGYVGITLSSFGFGLAAVLLAYSISRKGKLNETLGMVLAGMMISTLFSSATSFLKLIADTDSVLPAITYWLMGSLASVRVNDLVFAGIPITAGLVVLYLLRWRINLLTVEENEAKSMGINTTRLRAVVIICATLVTAASVSVSGLIGWVGLVIPHICRLVFGQDYSRLMPASMVMGAAYLLVVDAVARMAALSEIPLGILTSVIGAPVFIWLIMTGGSKNGA
ncbi:MAG: iron ABC transporter permease [Firmicutes bacterium]|nr:iron ABC transporter permease [Bacillota bacterium]